MFYSYWKTQTKIGNCYSWKLTFFSETLVLTFRRKFKIDFQQLFKKARLLFLRISSNFSPVRSFLKVSSDALRYFSNVYRKQSTSYRFWNKLNPSSLKAKVYLLCRIIEGCFCILSPNKCSFFVWTFPLFSVFNLFFVLPAIFAYFQTDFTWLNVEFWNAFDIFFSTKAKEMFQLQKFLFFVCFHQKFRN